MGAALTQCEHELFDQQSTWNALDQVVEFKAAGKAAIHAEWEAAGRPEIDIVWMNRSLHVGFQPMKDSVLTHGAPPRLDELAEAKRTGQLDLVVAEANLRFHESKARLA